MTRVMGPVRASVVICTHNRSADLDNVLRSLTTQAATWAPHEVIVVDNASTDDTHAVVTRWQTSLPLRYVSEPVIGLCHARNTGWRAARGNVIALLDDDAIASPEWLGELVAVFETSDDRLGCVGGKVDPIWEAPRPLWLTDRIAHALTIVDWSPEAKVITNLDEEWPVGANMAARKQVFEAVGGFEPDLDRIGRRLLSGGDVYFARKAQGLGYRCEYHPAVRVSHRTTASRLQKSWFRERYYWQGVSNAVAELIDDQPDLRRRFSKAARRLISLLREPRLLMAFARSSDDPRVFERQCWTWIRIGHIAGLVGAARR
jgi:glycosyltransferase involved in cell wall biosynthesis